MLQLSGFADEISSELHQQIEGCQSNGIRQLELRSVFGTNVLDLTGPQRATVKSSLTNAGMSVATIASPIGKVPITEPWPEHFERFKIAVDAAEFFGASMIRIFSYYPPGGPGNGSVLPYHDEVLQRMLAKIEYLGDRPITLVHENERYIFGEKLEQCVFLMEEVDSPRFRCAFDFANFVQAGEKPLDNWPVLKPYTTHFHIKDALLASGKIVPAGKGDGQLAPILKDAYQSGYRGLLSLEPHLSEQGRLGGFSGPQLFTSAVQAFRDLCQTIDVPLERVA